MVRVARRLDGHKFEDEFSSTFSKKYYLQRLHTMNTGYSGLTQPADFILFGNTVAYIELKETSKDRFSFSQMEQLPEITDFEYAKTVFEHMNKYKYLVIVHFIEQGIIKVVDSATVLQFVNDKKTLKYDSDAGKAFESLKHMLEELEI